MQNNNSENFVIRKIIFDDKDKFSRLKLMEKFKQNE